MKSILSRFPNASQSVRTLNPQIDSPEALKLDGEAYRRRARHSMTKTEAQFAEILRGMKHDGEIQSWIYEGITLRWHVGNDVIRYTPDFVVFESASVGMMPLKLIEVKGAFTGGKFARAVERFRHAKTYWPQFNFELHQRHKGGQWERMI